MRGQHFCPSSTLRPFLLIGFFREQHGYPLRRMTGWSPQPNLVWPRRPTHHGSNAGKLAKRGALFCSCGAWLDIAALGAHAESADLSTKRPLSATRHARANPRRWRQNHNRHPVRPAAWVDQATGQEIEREIAAPRADQGLHIELAAVGALAPALDAVRLAPCASAHKRAHLSALRRYFSGMKSDFLSQAS